MMLGTNRREDLFYFADLAHTPLWTMVGRVQQRVKNLLFAHHGSAWYLHNLELANIVNIANIVVWNPNGSNPNGALHV